MIIRKSADFGRDRIKMPSEPIPNLLSHSFVATEDQFKSGLRESSSTMKSFPTPCILVKRISYNMFSLIVTTYIPFACK